MSYKIQQTMNFLRVQKERLCASEQDSADLPPHIIIVKDGVPAGIFIAPSMDREIVMEAAAMCKVCFDPDSITVCFDAFIKKQSEEYEEGNETECLVCHKVDRNNEVEMCVMPYDYTIMADENDSHIVWQKSIIEHDKAEGMIDGSINQVLTRIMNLKYNPKEIKKLMLESGEKLSLHGDEDVIDDEHFAFCSIRACMSQLMDKKFKVIDLISYKYPEWTGANEKGIELLDEMIKMKIMNKKHYDKIVEIINKNIGTPAFVERFEHYLTMSNCKLPDDMTIKSFTQLFQQMCISPQNFKNNSIFGKNRKDME